MTGFLGPNGVGQVDDAARAARADPPDERRARSCMGKPVPRARRTRCAPSAPSLDASDVHPGRTGRSHLRTLAAAAGLPNSRVDEVLDMTELTPARDRRVKGYSMGMRQRLALAAALLGDPKILMLDEPANGLDPQGMRWLRDILVALAAEGRAVLISSHVLSEVEQTVDSVVVIGVGRLVMQGTLQDLVAGDTRPALVRSPRMDELRALLEAAGATRRAATGAPTRCSSTASSLEEIGTLAAEHGIPVFELTRARRDARGPLPRADRRERQRAMRILRSEWLKLVSVPTTWLLLGTMLLIEGLAAGLLTGLARHRRPQGAQPRDAADRHAAADGPDLHARRAAGDERVPPRDREPRRSSSRRERERVIAAKLAVGLVVGIVVGAAVHRRQRRARPVDPLQPRRADVDGDLAVNVYIGVGTGIVLGCLFGVALGALLRNQILTIVVGLVLFLVRGVVALFIGNDVGKYFPGEALLALQGTPGAETTLLGQVDARARARRDCVALAVAGIVVTRYREIN